MESSSPTPAVVQFAAGAADSPDPFSFTDLTDLSPDVPYRSGAVTLAGFTGSYVAMLI